LWFCIDLQVVEFEPAVDKRSGKTSVSTIKLA
jgi:hypothetical protein